MGARTQCNGVRTRRSNGLPHRNTQSKPKMSPCLRTQFPCAGRNPLSNPPHALPFRSGHGTGYQHQVCFLHLHFAAPSREKVTCVKRGVVLHSVDPFFCLSECGTEGSDRYVSQRGGFVGLPHRRASIPHVRLHFGTVLHTILSPVYRLSVLASATDARPTPCRRSEAHADV